MTDKPIEWWLCFAAWFALGVLVNWGLARQRRARRDE